MEERGVGLKRWWDMGTFGFDCVDCVIDQSNDRHYGGLGRGWGERRGEEETGILKYSPRSRRRWRRPVRCCRVLRDRLPRCIMGATRGFWFWLEKLYRRSKTQRYIQAGWSNDKKYINQLQLLCTFISLSSLSWTFVGLKTVTQYQICKMTMNIYVILLIGKAHIAQFV